MNNERNNETILNSIIMAGMKSNLENENIFLKKLNLFKETWDVCCHRPVCKNPRGNYEEQILGMYESLESIHKIEIGRAHV